MINAENIYFLAKALNLEIMVIRNGVVSRYRYLGDVLCKLN